MLSPFPREGVELLSLIDVGRAKNPIDRLLADVPALSVGLLGFATLTFFMILKKVKLAPFLILTSVLFTFFAAILDLARISLYHDNTGQERYGIKRVDKSLVTIRESLLSVSTGLRFLYFWAFVSQPPLCELGPDSFLRLHSGSWLHWGLTGRVLRAITLTSSIAILVLQAVWRLITKPGGPVYNIESSLEISTSVVYMVKLFLNSLIVERHCRRETLWQYSTTLSALLINLGVGIGNLLAVPFSESALGRLLLATELYILIVSSMIFSFYIKEATATSLPLPRSRDKRASSFRGLHVSFYDNGLGLVGEAGTNPVEPGQSSPSWVSWDAPQRQPSQSRSSYGDGRRPRSEEEAELGVNSSLSKERGPSVPEDVLPSSVNSSDPITREISEGFSSSPTVQFPSGSGNDNGKSSTPPGAVMTTAPDSPTLPPNGIGELRETNLPPRKAMPSSDGSIASSQLTGYEDLLREQNELDRSIAEVRAMYSLGRSGGPLRGASPDTISDNPERNRLRESSTTVYGPTSASGRSDFSLSVFPEPPQVPLIAESLRRNGLRSSIVSAPTPTQTTYNIGEQVLPVSTAEGDNGAMSASGRRADSAATHYDVTSFIGDLTSPDQGSAAQIAKYLKDSDTDSETEDSIDLATIVTVERRPSSGVITRPQLVEKSSLIPDVPVSASASTTARPLDRPARDPPTRRPPPTSGPKTSPPPPPPTFARAPSARSLVTPTGRVGLPRRPKLDDSKRGDQQMGNVLNTAVFERR